MINDTNTAIGSIVLQKRQGLADVLADLIALGSKTYSHCGIYIGKGKMVAAQLGSGVIVQDAGAASSIALPYKWNVPWVTVSAAIKAQGVKYDLWAWWLALTKSNEGLIFDRFTCSSFVAHMILFDMPDHHFDGNNSDINFLDRRGITPDEIAEYVSKKAITQVA